MYPLNSRRIGPGRINLGHPTARDLIVAVAAGRQQIYDLLGNVVNFRLETDTSYGTNRPMLVFTTPQLQQSFWPITLITDIQLTNATTGSSGVNVLMGVSNPLSVNTQGCLFWRPADQAVTTGFALMYGNGWPGSGVWTYQIPSEGNSRWTGRIGMRSRDATLQTQYWRNGVMLAADSLSGGSTGRTNLQSSVPGRTVYMQTACSISSFMYIWRREISDAEMVAVMDNPGHLVLPDRRLVRSFFLLGEAGKERLAGIAAGVGAGVASMAADAPLAGAALAQAIAAADLAPLAIGGAAAGDGAAAGGVNVGASLQGSAEGQGVGTGATTTTVGIAGAAAGVAAGAGALLDGVSLAGGAVGIGTASGSVSVAVSLAGAAVGMTQGQDGGLTLTVQLSGAAVGQSQGAATVAAGVEVAGVAQGSGAAAAEPAVVVGLSGTAAGQGEGSASAVVQAGMQGAGAGTGAGGGTLNLVVQLEGDAAAAAGGAGTLWLTVPLGGNAAAEAAAQGTLTITAPLGGDGAGLASGAAQVQIASTLGGAAAASALVLGELQVIQHYRVTVVDVPVRQWRARRPEAREWRVAELRRNWRVSP